MAFRRYNTDQDEFDRLLNLVNGNFHEFIGRLDKLKDATQPLASLRQLIGKT